MGQIKYIITLFVILSACSNKTHETKSDTLKTKTRESRDGIPADGKYRYDMAFAEWQGQSMGEKVTVIIKGDAIKITYEGDGNLGNLAKGEVLEEGRIMKHKSGAWIIATQESDTQLDEVGGCTDGPSTIDFENKKYWLC